MNVSAFPFLAAGFILWGLPTAGLFLIWNRINEERGFKLLLLSAACWVGFILIVTSYGRVID